MTKFYGITDLYAIFTAAGFQVEQRMNGMHRTGLNVTNKGVTYICAAVEMGAYPAERVAAVFAGTAPLLK